jgi:RNA polymerase sigma-70 factor (ECF subfamily)
VQALQDIMMASASPRPAEAEASFNVLLSAEKRRLYGIAYSILRDHAEAEDALQEAMLKAWRSWGSVRSEDARRTWLVRVCVNHCINRRRRLRLREFVRTDRQRDEAPVDPRFSGRLVDLDRSYRKLSPKQRAAVFLHYHHGYSIDECADLMKCSAGSVRTHMARAIASMRKEMAHA